jgi:hypothetical protein
MQPVTIALLIIIIIIIIATTYRREPELAKEFLNGFWEAPEQFCEKAALDKAYCMIEGNKMYLFIKDKNDILINKPINMTAYHDECKEYSQGDLHQFVIVTDEEIEPFPSNFTAILHINNGCLMFLDNDKVLLELYKNNKATNFTW